MKKTLLIATLLYSAAVANECTLTQSKVLEVTWKAYKTLGKIGVDGKFTSVEYNTPTLSAKKLDELFVGSSVQIDATKIDSGNKGRDEMLVKSFFTQMNEHNITATIKELTPDIDKPNIGVVIVSITMNKKTLHIPMNYILEGEKFEAVGSIDLGDFDALQALATINKSCYELHKGKTWTDVNIGFVTTIQSSDCKK